MKKSFYLFLTIISHGYTFSQTVEEKIALLTCNCIEKSAEITDESYKKCLTTSMTDVLFNKIDSTDRKKYDTVDGIQNLIQNANTEVGKNCGSLLSRKTEAKSNVFYQASKNKKAQDYYTIGKDFMEDEKYKLAIENMQKAIKDDPKFVLAYDDIGLSYRKLDDYDNAIKYYKKSLEIYPEGDFALMNIAVAYSFKQDYKTAIVYYEKLIKHQPENPEGYFGAGKSYFLLDNYTKALNNIFIAHRIYAENHSDYSKDSETVIVAIYQKMKAENKEYLFNKIAKENNIEFN